MVNRDPVSLGSAISSGTNSPFGAAATPDGTELWVTESGGNTVTVFDATSNAVKATIVVGIYPQAIAISPDGSTAYVANTGPNTGAGGSTTVSVISTSTKAVTADVQVGEAPRGVAITPDGTLALVTCADGLYAISTDGNAVTKSPVSFQSPLGVAVTPNGDTIGVVDVDANQVIGIATDNLGQIGSVAVGNTPWRLAFSSDSSTAYVTNANDDTVSVIDVASGSVSATIALGGFEAPNNVTKNSTYAQLHHAPTAVAVAPDGSVWVVCNVSSSLAVIDPATNTVSASLEIGLSDSPAAIAFVN